MRAVLCALLIARAAGAEPDPRAVVRQATLAVEGGREAELAARWQAEADRAALLGLATLARLAYDYPRAEELYRRLDGAPADRFAVHARLGRAWALEERGFSNSAEEQFG